MHGDPNLGLKQPKTDENAQFLAPGKPYRAHMNLKEAKNYLDICHIMPVPGKYLRKHLNVFDTWRT